MKRGGFYFIYATSGMVALALETIWIRWIGLHVGGTVVAATLVISCFFFCAAMGNALAVRVLPRIRRPLCAFAVSEGVFVFSALLTLPLLAYFGPLLGGGSSAWRWVLLTCLSVALPSLAQGLSFPFITEGFVASRLHRSTTGASFYAVNLVGAALGVVVGGLLLPVYVGYRQAYFLFCLVGLCGALLAWFFSGGVCVDKGKGEAAVLKVSVAVKTMLLVLMSGLLSIACELVLLVWFRQLVKSSLQATVVVLSVFILTLGMGAFVVRIVRKRVQEVRRLLSIYLVLNALILSVYGYLLSSQLGGHFIPQEGTLMVRTLWLCLKTTLFLLPLGLTLGGVFPLSWELIREEEHGRALGLATLVNKCGCAAGGWLGLFLFLPFFGLGRALWLCGLGYAFMLFLLYPVRVFWARALFLFGALALCGFFPARALKLDPAQDLLRTYFGNNHLVSVTEREASRHIMVDQDYILNGTAASLSWQRQESWIPLFFTPDPERVCYIGMASGIGADAALDLPIESLDAVELIGEVVEAAEDYFGAWSGRLFKDERARVVVDDGRRFIRDASEAYDSIICTLFLPSREGSSSLYSKDFFEEVLPQLSEEGTFCLWLPAYQLNKDLMNSIVRTFTSVFPHAVLLRGNLSPLQPVLGLFGSPGPLRFDGAFLEGRFADFKEAGLDVRSPFFRSVGMSRLLLLGDLQADSMLFSEDPVNTDNDPYIAFYGDQTLGVGERLRGLNLLRHFGRRFLTTDFPSCRLGETDAGVLLGGVRAGNYAYAASVASVYLPNETLRGQLQRERQVEQHLGKVERLLPGVGLRRDDLSF